MNYKYGLCRHPLYAIWTSMKQRCYNKKHKYYKYYGGRGITVCDIWRNFFMEFYKWSMESDYKEKLQIDRINNNGNYEPSNCRFIDCRTNNSNRRNNSKYGTGISKKGKKFQVLIQINGKRKYFGCYNTIERANEVYQLSLKALQLGKP